MSDKKTIIVKMKDGNSFAIWKEPIIKFDETLREPVLVNNYGDQFFLVRFSDVSYIQEPLKIDSPTP